MNIVQGTMLCGYYGSPTIVPFKAKEYRRRDG